MSFRPIYNEKIDRADVVEVGSGELMLVVAAGTERFEVPVLTSSIKGFRTDLIGKRFVIGFADPTPTPA
jgi:hypothetical protein